MRGMILIVVFASTVCQAEAPRRLTLREAEEIALKSHPSVAAARFSSLAAAEVMPQIAASRYPTVAGNLTGAGAPENSRLAAGGLNNPVIYSRLASGFTLNQLLWDFGRTSNLVASAQLRAGAAAEALQAARDQVVLEVDRAYFTALRTDAVLHVAQETVAARQLLVDQATELQKSGLKSTLDVSFARVSLEEGKLLLSAAQNEREAAYASFSAALGYATPQTFELVDEPFRIDALAASELIEKGLRDRADLRAREMEAQAAERAVQAERAQRYYPALSAMASAGWLPQHDGALRGRYSAAGINVSMPFLNGGLYKARENEASLRAQASRERERDLANSIARDITVALLNVNTAAERVHLTASLLNQAAQALDLAQSRYDLGLSSIVELSQAQLARTSAAIQNANAKYEYQLQRAVLEYYSGLRR